MDEKKINSLLDIERQISTQEKIKVKIFGKVYSVRQCSIKVENKIHYMLMEVKSLEHKINSDKLTLKEATKIQKKLRIFHSKQAAWYLLGNWGFIPLLHRLVTWWINWKTSEFTFYIINAAQGGAQKAFFTLNWESSKSQLKQFTNGLLISESLLQKRTKSAERMAEADSLPSQDSK